MKKITIHVQIESTYEIAEIPLDRATAERHAVQHRDEILRLMSQQIDEQHAAQLADLKE